MEYQVGLPAVSRTYRRRRFGYARLKRPEKAVVLRFLERVIRRPVLGLKPERFRRNSDVQFRDTPRRIVSLDDFTDGAPGRRGLGMHATGLAREGRRLFGRGIISGSKTYQWRGGAVAQRAKM